MTATARRARLIEPSELLGALDDYATTLDQRAFLAGGPEHRTVLAQEVAGIAADLRRILQEHQP